MTQRAIAAAIGTSQATVRRDLEYLTRHGRLDDSPESITPPMADSSAPRFLAAARALCHADQLDRAALLAVLGLTLDALTRLGPGNGMDRRALDVAATRLRHLARQPERQQP
jgi:DeoR/GlpR family transcriptional regulator of sugar metabolism